MPDNVDLDTVTVSGMYRLAAMELPWQAFSQMLVVHGGADTISQVIFAFSGGGVYVRTGNPTQVGGPGVWRDWKQLAVCTAPEVHDLPLADGWTPLTDDCTYCKTQENIVTVNFRAQHSTTISGISRETVATLPTGFRPTRWISGACALDSGDSGGAMNGGVHVDANGSVIINGFDPYRVVYAQISFLAVN